MKKILVLEDTLSEFKVIREELGNHYCIYPHAADNNLDPVTEFVKQCSLYVLKRRTEPRNKEDLKKYIEDNVMKKEQPDLLIVDISLRNQGGAGEDMEGGIIRKEIFRELYPDRACVFLTGAVSQSISRYIFPGDEYVFKYQDGVKNFKYVVRGKVNYFLDKIQDL